MMLKVYERIDRYLQIIWPDASGAKKEQKVPDLQLFLLALIGGGVFAFLIRDFPLLGYDWLTLFYKNQATDLFYPPWTSIMIRPFSDLPWRIGLAWVNGISLATVTLMTYQQGTGRWRIPATLLALFSLQTLMVLWLGHIDGLALLGIWALPWAVPLVLMKSTFIGFVVFTRKDWFLAASLFLGLSLLLWPGWSKDLINTLDFRSTHPSAAGWRRTGWLPVALGIVLLLKSKRGDLPQTLAAGSLLYPFILPYHYIVLIPALGALKGLRLLLAWLAAWAMIVPVALERYHAVYFIFPLAIWWFRYTGKNEDKTWLALIENLPDQIRRFRV